jgi:PIN domain nuclease of toxin-antitoxin system
VIVLDTHVWLWWLNGSPNLSARHGQLLKEHESEGLVVSAISCWGIGYKSAVGRLELGLPAREWIEQALAKPNIIVHPVTHQIALDAALLPGDLHGDPADRLIVATARSLACPLATADRKLLTYEHVTHL